MNRVLEVCPLETKYPQGGERQLIYAVTGRSINSKMLPADAGCIVDNVETIIAIYNAVKLGKPVTNRISTITGDAVEHPGNFYIILVRVIRNLSMRQVDLKYSLRRLFPVVR